MKDITNIISHLKLNPNLKKLSSYECFNSLKSLLPKHFRDAIIFMYKKNETIFFVFNHPAVHMEFNYKLNSISTVLSQLKKYKNICQEFQNVKAIVTNKRIFLESESLIEEETYIEESNANFKNPYNDKEMYDILEKIRDNINKNH